MLEAVFRNPWKLGVYARKLAKLHVVIHKVKLPEMPSMRERLQRKISADPQIPENERKSALEVVVGLPVAAAARLEEGINFD
jgi:hypothetical protein